MVGIPPPRPPRYASFQKFQAAKRSAGILPLPSSPPSAHPKQNERITALRNSSTKSSATNFSDSPDANVAQPNALSEAVSGAAFNSSNADVEAIASQSCGDKIASTGDSGVFFRADESKDIEAGDVTNGRSVMATAGAGATKVAMEETQRRMLPAASEHLAMAAIEEVADRNEEEGLGRAGNGTGGPSPVRHADSSSVPSLVPNQVDTIRGKGKYIAGERGRSGVREEERRAAEQVTAAAAVADGIGSNKSLRSAETIAENAEVAATTPDVDSSRQAAKFLRPPPIVTEDIPPILNTTSSGIGDDNIGDADESGSLDPEQIRRCFVAKTFSPSDLGLGEMRRDGGGAVAEVVTKESLMRARRRRRTIHKGITGIEGRRHTVDEVLGLDDPQAVLGSVPPERLFSITGMFHPEAPVKVGFDIRFLPAPSDFSE